MSEKVLCVDDDTRVLDAYKRSFRNRFDIDTAEGGLEALAAIAEQGPYAVVVSDMMMPGMDGVEFLSEVRESAPDTVRIMLTGDAHLSTAIQAAREARVFRFLCKPCPASDLAEAIQAGLEQYRCQASVVPS
jgi:DNA-binding NtrC family response regulator